VHFAGCSDGWQMQIRGWIPLSRCSSPWFGGKHKASDKSPLSVRRNPLSGRFCMLWQRDHGMLRRMENHKREFIEFLVQCDVLRFGDFTTKSGRQTPYFINAGRFRTGAQLDRLTRFYAQAITDKLGSGFDVLFGPAYKGIPLAAATAVALHREHGRDVGYCFNRKEAKNHGEGGVLVGHDLRDGDRVLFIEDVTTAGTSIRETLPVLRAAAKVQLAGLVVAVDRQERGTTELNGLTEISEHYSMPTFAIATIDEIIAHLREHPVDGRMLLDDATYRRVLDYRKQHAGTR
jgi:orotate phosphoribosyltransferase